MTRCDLTGVVLTLCGRLILLLGAVLYTLRYIGVEARGHL